MAGRYLPSLTVPGRDVQEHSQGVLCQVRWPILLGAAIRSLRLLARCPVSLVVVPVLHPQVA